MSSEGDETALEAQAGEPGESGELETSSTSQAVTSSDMYVSGTANIPLDIVVHNDVQFSLALTASREIAVLTVDNNGPNSHTRIRIKSSSSVTLRCQKGQAPEDQWSKTWNLKKQVVDVGAFLVPLQAPCPYQYKVAGVDATIETCAACF